jgi:hypothetical protein
MKRREVGKVAWASALDWWKNPDPGLLLRSSPLVYLGVARVWGNFEKVSLDSTFHQCLVNTASIWTLSMKVALSSIVEEDWSQILSTPVYWIASS